MVVIVVRDTIHRHQIDPESSEKELDKVYHQVPLLSIL
jgi:hypothetical protein